MNDFQNNRFRILVADDEEPTQELYREILSPAMDEQTAASEADALAETLFKTDSGDATAVAFDLTVCRQGDEAVAATEKALAQNRPFAVVFLDVHMPPGPDGVWAAEQIRFLDPHVEILIVTAYSEVQPMDIAARVLPAHKLLCIQKPFHPQEVFQFAHSLCSKWHMEKELLNSQIQLEKRVAQRTADLAVLNRALQKDIEKRKKAEKLIEKAKKEWERTFDAIDDMVTILNPEGRFVRMNRATSRFMDADYTELIGKRCTSVCKLGPVACPHCPVTKCIETQSTHSAEIEYSRQKKVYTITSSPIFDNFQTFIGVVRTAKDITEQKNLEKQLRQAQKMEAVGTLAGGIAHDFNNILMTILMNIEFVLSKMKDDDLARSSLDLALKASYRAKDLIKQILTFSRKDDQVSHPLAIIPIVKESLKLLRSSLPSTIEMDEQIVAKADTVLAAPTAIHQVVINLCTNAAHAMRRFGGKLTVALSESDISADDPVCDHLELKPGAYLKLSVQDTGCGMSADTIERIFEPFFTTKKPGEGTGMGLAAVHGIVSGIGGAISVASEVDKGAVFNVFLPKVAQKEAEQPETRDAAFRGNERLLVVDDEASLVLTMEMALGNLGYQVVGETDSRQALKTFAAAPDQFDLVVTDQTMPHMTGMELAQHMLALRPDLPIILCTGFSQSVTEEKTQAIGIRELFLKPVSIIQLSDKINVLLNNFTKNNPS
jgi:two-component system cell cycle sensor histidine kinase/response regulator CckA